MSTIVDAISGQYSGGIRLNDFAGGRVNVPEVVGPAYLKRNQAQRSKNMDIAGRSIRKMRGFSRLTDAAITGDISSIYYDVTTDKVYVAYADKIGELNAGHTAISQLTGATGLTSNSIWSFTRLGDYLVMVNGADTGRTWDGTTFATITTPPVTWTASNRPTFVCSWMSRVFAAGCGEDVDLLYYSELDNPNEWTAGTDPDSAGAIRIGNDGNPIKALWPLANGLLIFKDPGLYYLSGQRTYNSSSGTAEFDQTKFDWDLLTSGIDCIAHRALVNVDQTLYVWGRENVFEVKTTFGSAQVQVKRIGNNILNDILQVSAATDQICAVHYPDRKQVWFGVATDNNSTTIDAVHAYSYDTSDERDPDGWMYRTGYEHKCMANVRDPNGRSQIYSGGYDGDAYIFKQNDGVDFHESAMECEHYTSWLELGLTARGHSPYSFVLLGPQTSGNLSYSYAYDFEEEYYDAYTIEPGSNSSSWNNDGSATWGDTYGSGTTGTWISGQSFTQKIPMFGKGRRIQYRFYSNLVGADFDILEVLQPVSTVGFA